jgi:hypothetical protein
MFNYIYDNDSGFTCYDKYFKYIDEIKDKLPLEIYLFASDKDRYDLSNRKSLHDSWITSLSVDYNDVPEDKDQFATTVNLELLGAYHDRKFILSYDNVYQYSIVKIHTKSRLRRDDLLIHEIRISDQGYLEHTIQFDGGLTFFVSCKLFAFKEILGNYSAPDQIQGLALEA